jgi:CHAT domain-containing protein/tetratricopeptide (TPR) repeat protein
VSKEEKHLTIEQIESLIGARSAPPGVDDSVLLEHARQHLLGCSACQRAVSMEQHGEQILRKLAADSAAAPTDECPSSQDFYDCAGGLLDEAASRRIMTHVSECDYCGPKLREAVRDLHSDLTAEEAAFVASLESSKPEWQAEFARRLADATGNVSKSVSVEKSRETLHRRFPRSALALGAAAVVVVAGLILGGRSFRSPSYANKLLARAYSEQRTLELRIPGAQFSPLRVQRGSESSRMDRPSSLLEAEDLIRKRLIRRPNDADWLEARARADLLDGNYDSALRALQELNDLRPDNVPVLTDLATAYFERGQSAENPVDQGNAVETLGKALAKAPDDPIALFNRALVCERLFLYKQAIDDWEHYLRVDPQGSWADEARRHLEEMKGRLRHRENSRAEPLLTPSEIAEAGADDPAVMRRIDERIEDYVSVASMDWLPKAYASDESVSGSRSELIRSVEEIAEVSKQKHSDLWLQDLLAGATFRGYGSAVALLSSAVRTNDAAETAKARAFSNQSAELFRRGARSDAGILRAELESLAASNIDQDGAACLRWASRLEERMRTHSYRWLEVQFHLEKGSCFWLIGNLGAARQQYLTAAEEAESAKYKTIYLRTQSHFSGAEGAIGDTKSALSAILRALGLFWSGNYPDIRGYNLYFSLYEVARMSSQPYLEMAVWRDGLALNDSSTDVAQRAMAHSFVGSTASAVGDLPLAEKEFETASRLFSQSPEVESTNLARLEMQTRLAGVEASRGEVAEALSRLLPVEESIPELKDRYLSILFYNTLGEAEAKSGDTRAATAALESAIAVSELELQSLPDERNRVDWEQMSGPAYRSLTDIRMRKGDSEGALELWEWYRAAATRSRKKALPDASSHGKDSSHSELHEVARRLRGLTRETVVSYALFPQGLVTWVYDDRGIVSHWTDISSGELQARITRFQRLCSDPDSDESTVREAGRALYEILLAPVESYLASDRTLVIELDDGLGGLPVDALVDRRNHYIAERGPTVLSLGLYYRHDSTRRGPLTRGSTALVAAVPDSRTAQDLHLGSLPDAVPEAEMIGRDFPLARLLTGPSASIEGIRSRLPQSALFHFAGHALNSPRETGLLLSDGLLTASSLDQKSLRAMELAVFSGCGTQYGSNGQLRDSDSLVRVFLRAGVPHVVASRWSVDSSASREFMESFYRNLLEGNPVELAANRAEAEVRSHSETSHPFYWSAFAVFGTT